MKGLKTVALAVVVGLLAFPAWAELDLLHKYAHLTGGRSPDGSFKNCPAPTPEMIEFVKAEALPYYDASERMDFHYALRAPAAPQEFIHGIVVPQIKALTGLSPHDYFDHDLQNTLYSDPDLKKLNGILIFFHDDLYRTFFSNKKNFEITSLIIEDRLGITFEEYDEAFLEQAKILADQFHQPGVQDGFFSNLIYNVTLPLYEKPKRVELYDWTFIDDKSSSIGAEDVKAFSPTFYKTNFQKYKADYWKYVYLRLIYIAVINHDASDPEFDIEFSSMFSDTVELRFEALKHMIENECYTPFDAAFLWVLYGPDDGGDTRN